LKRQSILRETCCYCLLSAWNVLSQSNGKVQCI